MVIESKNGLYNDFRGLEKIDVFIVEIMNAPNSTGGLTPFRPLSGLQEVPVATREESGVLRFPRSRELERKRKPVAHELLSATNGVWKTSSCQTWSSVQFALVLTGLNLPWRVLGTFQKNS